MDNPPHPYCCCSASLIYRTKKNGLFKEKQTIMSFFIALTDPACRAPKHNMILLRATSIKVENAGKKGFEKNYAWTGTALSIVWSSPPSYTWARYRAWNIESSGSSIR